MNKIKKIIKRTVTTIVGTTELISSACALTVKQEDYDYLKNRTYFSVVKEELDANMNLMDNSVIDDNWRNGGILRLKPNASKEIYLYIDEKVSEDIQTKIHKVINNFNNIFDYFNDNYNFVFVDEQTFNKKLEKKKSSISFSYSQMAENVNGENHYYFNNYDLEELNETQTNAYIYKSDIYFNPDSFNNSDDNSQLRTIKHELLHSLGLNDMYYGYVDETSIMNANVRKNPAMLSPNDLKMLYCAYGNRHINSDGSFNQEKLDEVKEMFKQYEVFYYNQLIKNIKKLTNKTFKEITLSDVDSKEFIKDDAQIKINGDEFEFVDGDYKRTGKLVCCEDSLIIPDIYFDGRNNFLILAKTDENIECLDAVFTFKKFINEQTGKSSTEYFTILK